MYICPEEKQKGFFRLMSEEEKSFFLTLFFSTPFSIGKKVLYFFLVRGGQGISWLEKEKKINCFCHMISSAIYFPSNYNYLLLAIL